MYDNPFEKNSDKIIDLIRKLTNSDQEAWELSEYVTVYLRLKAGPWSGVDKGRWNK